MAVMYAALVIGLLANLLVLTAKILTIPAKLLVDMAIAIQYAAIDLYNTVRGWISEYV